MGFLRWAMLLVLACGLTNAQQPFTPNVAAVGNPGQILYGNGVKSIDNGLTWTPLYLNEAGLAQPPFNFVEVDLDQPNTVYVATTAAEGSFWKSTDAGATWRRSNGGLPNDVSPDALFQVTAPHALYLKAGNRVYKSNNRGDTWLILSQIPLADPIFTMSVTNRNKMYAVDREPGMLDSLRIHASDNEGGIWRAVNGPNSGLTFSRSVTALGVLREDPNILVVSVAGCCEIIANGGQGAYRSNDGGQNFVRLAADGIGPFNRWFAGPGPNLYATSAVAGGYYRSKDNGVTWKSFFLINGAAHGIRAVDPNSRNIVWGISTANGNTLVRSTDSGDTWTPIASTITPTLGKMPILALELEEGAPYSQPFNVTAVENAAWVLPVNLAVIDGPWLTLAGTTGATPFATNLTIDTTGLAPGVHNATIRITSEASFNKTVNIPVQLTIRARGSIGSQYRITTVAGNGSNTADADGAANGIGIGIPESVAVDELNRLLIGAGNRVRRLNGSNLVTIAGTGEFGSTGDGGHPLNATLSANGIAVRGDGTIYITESGFSKVRRIAGPVIDSFLDKTKVPAFDGSGVITLDGQNRLVLMDVSRLVRYDGTTFAEISTTGFVGVRGLAVAANGDVYLAVQGSDRIFRVPATGGAAIPFAGTGVPGYSGDGGDALLAQINNPAGLAFDRNGTLFFADSGNQRVRAISPAGIIRTIAGTGLQGFAGDGLTANFAQFDRPEALAIDHNGDLYVAERNNFRVRKLSMETAPVPQPTGLSHGASGSPKLSPGSLFSIYGELLATVTRLAGVTPWPRTLEGVTVTIDGVTAPLYYISPTQINGQIPLETAAGNATATVTVNGVVSAQIVFQVVAANPGILIYNGDRAVAVNPNGSVNAPNAPAKPGNVVLLYFSGIGVPDVPVATGAASPSAEPLARANYPFSIKVNGQEAEVFYLGLAPGFPALCQANFKIPNLDPGDYLITITVNGEVSNAVLITIGPAA